MIQKPKLLKLKISDLKFDEENPNYMTEEQMDVLRESFKRYGNLHPITIDQNNIIADGEHRVKIYQENGEEFIPGYKLDLDDNARRMLRQIMNKNRGQHEPEKDYNELMSLIANKSNTDLLELMGVNHSTLSELQEIINANSSASKSLEEIMAMPRDQDGNPQDHRANSFLFGNIKQITAYFDNETYADALSKMQTLMGYYNIDNHTDLLWTILNYVFEKRLELGKDLKVLHVEPPQKQEVKYTYLE